MLGWRIGLSAVLIPSLLAIFAWDASLGTTAPALFAFCLLLTVRATFEMATLLQTRNMQPNFMLCATCNVAMIVAAWAHTKFVPESMEQLRLWTSLGYINAVAILAFVALLFWEAARYQRPGNSLESLGANLITVFYAGVLLAVIAQFRWFPNESIGYFAIGSVIIAVKSGDTMAYTFGRLWGKRKMIPRLSPGKTWMGGVGAIVGSCLGTWLWLRFGGALFEAKPNITSVGCVLAYGAVMGVVGLVGDLCESLIKRDAEKKDSATLMPGFGGLLDLMDSPLFAGPIALGWWIFWPPAV